MATMHVEVVSAEKQLLSTEVTGLFARSTEGEIGILPGHQPALIALDIAPVTVHLADGGEERIAVHNGFLYVDRDKVIVLADIAELASQIDVERAQRRQSQLEGRPESAEQDAAVQASLRKQQLRLELAGRG